MNQNPYVRDAAKNPNWKGGKHYREDGYVLVRIGVVPGNVRGTRYKLEHRIVMEKVLGRPLLRSEVVHHKDGNKSNNHPDNLELITQAEHARIHYYERETLENGQFV